MAVAFHIAGPTKVQHAIPTALTTFADLGRTDNDDLIRVDISTTNEIITANDTGDSPAEIIYTGTTAVITMTLVKWDSSKWVVLTNNPGTTTEGDGGTIGTPWVSSYSSSTSELFAIRILPSITGEKIYTFSACYLDRQHSGIHEFGNTAKRMRLTINAMVDTSNKLYVVTTV